MQLFQLSIRALLVACAFQIKLVPELNSLSDAQSTMIRSILGEIPESKALKRGVQFKLPLAGTANDTLIDHKYAVSFDRLIFEDGKLSLIPSKSAVHGKAIFVEAPPTRTSFEEIKYADAKVLFGESRGGIDGWNDGSQDHSIEQWLVFSMQGEKPVYFDIRAFVTRPNGAKRDAQTFESVSIIECQLSPSDAIVPTSPITSIESSGLLAHLEVLLERESKTGRQAYYEELNKIRDNPTIVAIRPFVDAYSNDTPRSSYHLRALLIGGGPSVKPWKIAALTEAIEICIKCLSKENLKPELATLLLERCGGGRVAIPYEKTGSYVIEVIVSELGSIQRKYESQPDSISIEESRSQFRSCLNHLRLE